MTLTIIDSAQQPRLNAEKLQRDCEWLQQSHISFCGPMAFSAQIKSELARLGIDIKNQFAG